MENKPGRETPLLDGPISRRSLLKGLGGGALAVGASGLLEACSSKVKGSGTSSTDKIVIGFVTPQTGQLAGFASGDNFVVDRIRGTDAYTKGFKVGSKTYSVDILVKDSQSDPNRASEVARELILQDHADLIVTSSTPETTNPVATVCETQGVPCLSTVVPWQAWFFGRQADPANPSPVQVHDDVLLRRRGVRRLLRPHVGPRSTRTRSSAACSRTTRTGTRSAMRGRRSSRTPATSSWTAARTRTARPTTAR